MDRRDHLEGKGEEGRRKKGRRGEERRKERVVRLEVE